MMMRIIELCTLLEERAHSITEPDKKQIELNKKLFQHEKKVYFTHVFRSGIKLEEF